MAVLVEALTSVFDRLLGCWGVFSRHVGSRGTSSILELSPPLRGNGMHERVSVRRGQDDRRGGPDERREQDRRSAERRQARGTPGEGRRMVLRRTHVIRSGSRRRDGERRAEAERRMAAFV